MTKNELIEKIAQESGIRRKDVEISVEGVIKYIRQTVAEGHTVYLRGFGSFIPVRKKPKAVRNFHTNEIYTKDPGMYPKFKPYNGFLAAMNKR